VREKSLPLSEAKRLIQSVPLKQTIGESFLTGPVSCHSLEVAGGWQRSATAPITFSSAPSSRRPSKETFGPPQGTERLREVCRSVSIPVLAIGYASRLTTRKSCLVAGCRGHRSHPPLPGRNRSNQRSRAVTSTLHGLPPADYLRVDRGPRVYGYLGICRPRVSGRGPLPIPEGSWSSNLLFPFYERRTRREFDVEMMSSWHLPSYHSHSHRGTLPADPLPPCLGPRLS